MSGIDASLADLLAPGAEVKQLGTGFIFTEGPVWHPRDQYLLFSDMPGDVRRRYADGKVTEAKRPANKCNGMTYDSALNLIVCEHSTSKLMRERPDGTVEVIASHFEGKELNSPNDVCVRADGSIYFSDPTYGRMPGFGVERPVALGFQGVYRAPPKGGLELVVPRDLFAQPNGLCFSPDEKILYVNDSDQQVIRAFDVQADGSLKNARLFAEGLKEDGEAGGCDGMKCDTKGNVWVTGCGGILVYSPQGQRIGRIRTPEMAANLHWGGKDFRTLYITATKSLYAIETRIGGRREAFMG